MEIIKKGLVLASDSICCVEVILLSMFCTYAAGVLKQYISLILLRENLCFQVVNVLVKLSSHVISAIHLKLSTNLQQLGFRLCVNFLKDISMFLEVIDPFVGGIWSFITFHRGFFIIISKLMKPQASFFQDRFFIRPSILLPNFLFIS